ncbi:MAG TPA: hypothetical protein VNF27_10400 [Candidatus Binataceae bacterium]|nr:hypothetical protein [Candidatus Binataceae bacterium]
MEYQELIGSRGSLRFFDLKRPVEKEKNQKIFEACLGAFVAPIVNEQVKAPAPLRGRREEVRGLARNLNLPE